MILFKLQPGKPKNMKQTARMGIMGIALTFAPAQAEPNDQGGFLNQVTLSARFGANISARFSPRLTASGGLYNFLDGYVLPDSKAADAGLPFAFDPTGTYPGGITHYWGYDNSARQNSPGTKEILLTSLTGVGDPLARKDDVGVLPGFELGYKRQLGKRGKWTYGVEGAVNYLNISLDNRYAVSDTGSQSRFPYTFNGVSGNVPPATYQGTYNFNFGGPNFDISGLPGSVSNVVVNFAGSRNFEADLWGFRVGPYLSRPLGKHAHINFVGGLALGLVSSRASWTQALTVGGVTDPAHSGSGSGSDLLVGYYFGANLSWQLSRRWDLNAGAQYQNLGKYRQGVGERDAELDLSNGIYFIVGLSYSF